jgi:cytoskeletal protein RodZ
MTIKFFPLYFARQVWLSPVATQSIYVVLPIFMMVLSRLGQAVARRIGRVVTSVLMAYLGCAALAGLWMLEQFVKPPNRHFKPPNVAPPNRHVALPNCQASESSNLLITEPPNHHVKPPMSSFPNVTSNLPIVKHPNVKPPNRHVAPPNLQASQLSNLPITKPPNRRGKPPNV